MYVCFGNQHFLESNLVPKYFFKSALITADYPCIWPFSSYWDFWRESLFLESRFSCIKVNLLWVNSDTRAWNHLGAIRLNNQMRKVELRWKSTSPLYSVWNQEFVSNCWSDGSSWVYNIIKYACVNILERLSRLSGSFHSHDQHEQLYHNTLGASMCR